MTALLEGTQTGDREYVVEARPLYGRNVALYVVPLRCPRSMKYIVARDSDALARITEHRTFEAAVKSANSRAKRYISAYSKPRGLAVVTK